MWVPSSSSLPVSQRGRVVLLECGGRLVFCEGVGPAEGFQVTGRTRRALEVEIRPRDLSEERNHTGCSSWLPP